MSREQHERKIALCYVRQSYTRDGNDMNSPQRQKSNIQKVCDERDWTPEWYEDVGGHKPGRFEANRPQWMQLKSRISDNDVVALVVNDLSRAHRKSWRIGSLVEQLVKYDVTLVFAAAGREQLDTSTPNGRAMLQMRAMFDEMEAESASTRVKDSIAYRKRQGKSVGMAPFGTIRDDNGYLIPSPQGAWYLPDGKFIAGDADNIPTNGAIWRSYFDCARYILEIYSENRLGLEKIAYILSDEGWAFRDRKGNPRPVNRDDIRRVVANWVEYGGGIMGKAKDRKVYDPNFKPDEIFLDEERTVFPLELLRQVGTVKQDRTKKPKDSGTKRVTYSYPLSVITLCAHCVEQSIKHNDAHLITVLTGTNMNGTRRYRHAPGIKCGCTNKSVMCEILENEFSRLLQLLTINPDSINLMAEVTIQADLLTQRNNKDFDIETQKLEAIARCNKRINATVVLFGDGMIDEIEYRRRIDENKREITYWEARTTESEKLGLEFAMCVDAVNSTFSMWEDSSPDDKQGMARNLFEEIYFDLDTHRITGFKMKDWAERFLVVRSAFYDADEGNKNTPDHKDLKRALPHRRLCVSALCFGLESGFKLLSYKALRRTIKRSAHGLSRKSTIRRVSRSYTMYSNRLCVRPRLSSSSPISHNLEILSIASEHIANSRASFSISDVRDFQ
jgi:DNA invertase Pin-like site-specific DNA recombinase